VEKGRTVQCTFKTLARRKVFEEYAASKDMTLSVFMLFAANQYIARYPRGEARKHAAKENYDQGDKSSAGVHPHASGAILEGSQQDAEDYLDQK